MLRGLVDQVAAELARRGCGARRMEAWFLREDRRACRRSTRPSCCPALRGSRATCSTCCGARWRRCETEEGFTGIQLDVPVFERLAEEQVRLAGTGGEEQQAGAELAHLIERLRARLEPGAVQGVELVESYLPERAYRATVSGVGDGRRRRKVRKERRACLSTRCSRLCLLQHSSFSIQHFLQPLLPPLHLLAVPVEVG